MTLYSSIIQNIFTKNIGEFINKSPKNKIIKYKNPILENFTIFYNTVNKINILKLFESSYQDDLNGTKIS